MASINKQTFTVVITGMGPYPNPPDVVEINTSYVVASTLPKVLKPHSAANPSDLEIEIFSLSHPVKTEYKYVRQFSKNLQDQFADKEVDLYIHLGEARGWDFVSVERGAYQQGMSSSWWSKSELEEYYLAEDNAGETIHDIGPCPWKGKAPMGLRTVLDTEDVAEKANAILNTLYTFSRIGDQGGVPIPVRPHDESGPYLCGFIYYETLANLHVRNMPKEALFCHIPGYEDEDGIERTRVSVLAIIVSAAKQLFKCN